MQDLVSLIEAGDKCGYCERPWHKCKCQDRMGDDIWGDDEYDHREYDRFSCYGGRGWY